MVKIKLTGEQIDEVVVFELQQSLELLLILDMNEGGEYLDPDFELIEALKTTLKYFMPHIEYTEYIDKYAKKEKEMISQLTGDTDTSFLPTGHKKTIWPVDQ